MEIPAMNKRRKLLLALSGASATTVWTKPVVDAVMLPVHAETTESILPTAPTPEPTPEPTPTPTPEPTPEPTPTPAPAPEPDAVVQWELNNLVFDDGGTASGSFTYNFTSDTVTNWDIAVSGGTTATFSERSYTMENSTLTLGSTSSVAFTASNESRIITIGPESPLTRAGGTVLLPLVGISEMIIASLTITNRIIDSGSLVGTVVV